MRKDILLPGLAVVGGAAGFGLRLLQWSRVYDPETLLFAHGSPITYALTLLIAALALIFLLSARSVSRSQNDLRPFRCPSTGYMALMAASAILFLAGGALGLLEGMEQLELWKIAPETHLVTYPAALILCALLALAAGPATLVLGKGAYRGTPSPAVSLLVVLPPLSALVWLFATHLAHGSDPVLMDYGFTLAAVALLLLAHYDTAGAFHDRPHPCRAAFTGLMGVTLGLTSLADHPTPFYAALTAAFLLSALASVSILLRNAFGPPWPKRLLEGRMPLEEKEQEPGIEDE